MQPLEESVELFRKPLQIVKSQPTGLRALDLHLIAHPLREVSLDFTDHNYQVNNYFFIKYSRNDFEQVKRHR